MNIPDESLQEAKDCAGGMSFMKCLRHVRMIDARIAYLISHEN